MALAAFPVVHRPIRDAGGIDVRCGRVVIGSHLAEQRLNFGDRAAQIMERGGKSLRIHGRICSRERQLLQAGISEPRQQATVDAAHVINAPVVASRATTRSRTPGCSVVCPKAIRTLAGRAIVTNSGPCGSVGCCPAPLVADGTAPTPANGAGVWPTVPAIGSIFSIG